MGIPQWKGKHLHTLPKGPLNLITDVPGVLVGHSTLIGEDINTGVTIIKPHNENTFLSKVMAAAHVINGFGKSAGIIQIQELGSIETPIALTNTFSVGVIYTALTKYMLANNPDIGLTTGTVNPLVLECNDGPLNDIRGMHVAERHFSEAVLSTSSLFPEGSVGAGRGMSCYGLKGGIGSSSRVLTIGGVDYIVGALVLTNFGRLQDFALHGRILEEAYNEDLMRNIASAEHGSVIIILATNTPLSSRQLSRISRRAQNGLAYTGSITGTGSGEIVISFSTANRIPHYEDNPILGYNMIFEDEIDLLFQATAECVEESVLSSMVHAEQVSGMGNKRLSLSALLPDMKVV